MNKFFLLWLCAKRFFILGFLICVFVTYAVCIKHLIFDKVAVDSIMFYCSAKNFWHHQSIYSSFTTEYFRFPHNFSNDLIIKNEPIYSLGTHYFKNLNPPLFTLLISPLGLLPYPLAALIWHGLLLCASAIALYLLYDALFAKKTIWGYFALLTLYLASAPAYTNMMIGELGSFCFLIVTVIWFWARTGKDYQAGILLGLLISLKYFFGLLTLLFFLQKRWRLMLSTVISMVLLNGLALFFCGKDNFIQHYQIIHHITWFISSWNSSLYGLLLKLTATIHAGKIMAPTWAMMYYCAAIATMLGYQIYLCYKPFLTRSHFDQAFSYTLIITLLITPLNWPYYFSILTIPLLVILQSITKKPPTMPKIFGYLITLFFLSIPLKLANATISGHPMQFYSNFIIGLLLLFIFWFYIHLTSFSNKTQSTLPLAKIQNTNIFPWAILSYSIMIFSFANLYQLIFLATGKIWD